MKHSWRAYANKNPFTGLLNIELNLPTSGEVHITFTNTLGQIVYEDSNTLAEGGHTLNMNLKNRLVPGVYYLTIKTQESELFTDKVIYAKGK